MQVSVLSSWQGAGMSAPRHPSAVRPWTVWTPLGVALAPLSVALIVATTALAIAAI